jgi:hypothetical protein
LALILLGMIRGYIRDPGHFSFFWSQLHPSQVSCLNHAITVSLDMRKV